MSKQRPSAKRRVKKPSAQSKAVLGGETIASALMNFLYRVVVERKPIRDFNARAERMGWLPSAPALKTNPLDVAKAATESETRQEEARRYKVQKDSQALQEAASTNCGSTRAMSVPPSAMLRKAP